MNVSSSNTAKDPTKSSHSWHDNEFGLEFQESLRAMDAPGSGIAFDKANWDIAHINATRDRAERFREAQLAKIFAEEGPQVGEPGGKGADDERIEGPGPYSWTKFPHLHDNAWRERMYTTQRRWSIEANSPMPDEPPNHALNGIRMETVDDGDKGERGARGPLESVLRRAGFLKR